MQTIAQQMITGGVTVLAIVNLDSASGAAIEQQAKKQGVSTIDYDRLTLGGSADYYVSYDNAKVGKLQGEGLQKCLGDKQANIAYLNGSPDDNNATLFSEGAHSVLDKVTNYKKVAEQAVPKWDAVQAADDLRADVHPGRRQDPRRLRGQRHAGQRGDPDPRQTEQPARSRSPVRTRPSQGLQNILAGDQCMTVWKPADGEAEALSDWRSR